MVHEELMDRVERRLGAVPSGDQLERLTRITSGTLLLKLYRLFLK